MSMALTFADESLSDESPEHVGAVVAVGGLVERLFAEEVALLDHLRGTLRRRTGGRARAGSGGHIESSR